MYILKNYKTYAIESIVLYSNTNIEYTQDRFRDKEMVKQGKLNHTVVF